MARRQRAPSNNHVSFESTPPFDPPNNTVSPRTGSNASALRDRAGIVSAGEAGRAQPAPVVREEVAVVAQLVRGGCSFDEHDRIDDAVAAHLGGAAITRAAIARRDVRVVARFDRTAEAVAARVGEARAADARRARHSGERARDAVVEIDARGDLSGLHAARLRRTRFGGHHRARRPGRTDRIATNRGVGADACADRHRDEHPEPHHS